MFSDMRSLGAHNVSFDLDAFYDIIVRAAFDPEYANGSALADLLLLQPCCVHPRLQALAGRSGKGQRGQNVALPCAHG